MHSPKTRNNIFLVETDILRSARSTGRHTWLLWASEGSLEAEVGLVRSPGGHRGWNSSRATAAVAHPPARITASMCGGWHRSKPCEQCSAIPPTPMLKELKMEHGKAGAWRGGEGSSREPSQGVAIDLAQGRSLAWGHYCLEATGAAFRGFRLSSIHGYKICRQWGSTCMFDLYGLNNTSS